MRQAPTQVKSDLIFNERLTDFSVDIYKLLDIIILSYKLSPHKINYPHKLRIICRKSDGFSLNDIDSKS